MWPTRETEVKREHQEKVDSLSSGDRSGTDKNATSALFFLAFFRKKKKDLQLLMAVLKGPVLYTSWSLFTLLPLIIFVCFFVLNTLVISFHYDFKIKQVSLLLCL